MTTTVTRRTFLGLTGGAVLTAGRPGRTGAADGPIKLGINLPTTGPIAIPGREVLIGLDMYFESIGHAVGGRKIELIKEDETADVQSGVAKARKLIEKDQVECLTGGSHTGIIYATIPLIIASRTPYLISVGGGTEITRRKRRNPYTYRTSYNIWQIGFPFGKFVAEKVAKRVHISAADYAAGREWSDAFKAGFTQAGGTVVGEIYPPLGTPDFVPYLTKIAQEKPEATFSFFVGSDAIRFLQAYEQLDLKRHMKLTITGASIDYDTLPATKNAALGAISPHWWNLDLKNPVNERLVAAYRARYKKTPSALVSWGWDGGQAMVEAIKRVGGDVSNRERLAAAFGGLRIESARGEIEIDRETHDVIQDLYIRETVAGDPLPVHRVVAKIPRVKDPFPNA